MRAEAEGRSLAQQAEIDAVRAEMAAALQAKDEELRKLEEEFGVGALSREQEHAKALAEQAEAAHEARVAHLQQMAVKRMMQAGLTKGWQTWLDMYLEHQRHKRMLASAAGRLMKPALSAALTHWRDDWQAEQKAALEEGQRLLRAEAEGRSLAQQAEIDAVRAEMAAALQAKDEQLQALAERSGMDILSQQQEAARALAEALEAEKEKRVAHLQQMAVKRMMQAGLTKGWQTWLDMYLEHQRHQRMLASAAGRLMKPALSAALTHWRDDWQAEQKAALEEGQRLLRAEAEGRSLAQQAEIDAVRAEMAAALQARDEQLQALAERSGMDILSQQQEAARALAEALEAEKEKRVAHLQQMAVKRMMQAGLTKGWQTWLDMYLEHQRHKRMLAAAAGRLMKPALSAALSAWREDWGEERQRILEEGQRLMRAEAEGRSLAQQAEIDAVRAEMAAALQAKDEELRRLEESFGADLSAQEREQAKSLEAKREKRTAHVMQMAAMRLSKRQLSLGWQTWLDAHREQQRKKRILAASAGRLSRPALSVCLSRWRRDWEAALMKDDNAWKLSQEKKRMQQQSSEAESAHQKQAHPSARRPRRRTALLTPSTSPPSPPFLQPLHAGLLLDVLTACSPIQAGGRTAARARGAESAGRGGEGGHPNPIPAPHPQA